MNDDSYARGLEEIRLLRIRLANLEQMGTAAQAPPADKPASFGDALNVLRTTGSASGSAVDALKRAVEGPRTTTTAPDPERLREATAILTADLRGSETIEKAFSAMQSRQARLNTLESVDPGSSGRTDPSDPAATTAADRLRRALTEEH